MKLRQSHLYFHFLLSTHWDKLNKPIEDWKEQKAWLEKRLIGKGFFDTKEMAQSNIMHSAAHIYNLCRDFDNLDQSDNITLMQFALGMRFDITNLKLCLSDMKALTNIDNINKVITDQLAKNYQVLLYEDIEKKYLDIVYNLKRIAGDNKKESSEFIEISKADINKMKAKIEEQKRNYEKIYDCKQQLTAMLKAVEKNTQKRLDKILPHLKNVAQNGERN